jgi:hypothetical protein
MESEAKPVVKGKFTFQFAGALFALSAVFELITIASEVPFFGSINRGTEAVAVHIIYAILFACLGIGLWRATRWVYRLIFIVTFFYTLDKIFLLLDRNTLEALVMHAVGSHDEILQFFDKAFILNLVSIVLLLFVLCWWGFTLYAYLRRAYFFNQN